VAAVQDQDPSSNVQRDDRGAMGVGAEFASGARSSSSFNDRFCLPTVAVAPLVRGGEVRREGDDVRELAAPMIKVQTRTLQRGKAGLETVGVPNGVGVRLHNVQPYYHFT
jgi:hypothetical protein